MTNASDPLPDSYTGAIRTLLRYSVVMAVVGLLSGILFQESAKKLDRSATGAGLHVEAVLHLALVHGHVFVTGVLLPLAMAGALLLARRVGGAELGPAWTRWLVQGYLPCAAAALALMLYKGYHVLLGVRGGETDLGAVDEAFFGGHVMLRHVVYGIAHVGMGVCLTVFLIGLWRSLKRRP